MAVVDVKCAQDNVGGLMMLVRVTLKLAPVEAGQDWWCRGKGLSGWPVGGVVRTVVARVLSRSGKDDKCKCND